MKKIFIVVYQSVVMLCLVLLFAGKLERNRNNLGIFVQPHYVLDDNGDGNYNVFVHQLNSTYTSQKNIFFKNLTLIPQNTNPQLGFCSELTLASVLMYYDSYYNDNIVSSSMINPAFVDLNNLASIGSLSFPSNGFDYSDLTATKSTYLSNATLYQNTNLLDNIICYANNNGYLENDHLGIAESNINSFVDDYLYDNGLLSILNHSSQAGQINMPSVTFVDYGDYGRYEFSSSSIYLSNSYESQIRDYISIGYPVIVHYNFLVDDQYYGYDIKGHTAIAYSTYFTGNKFELVYHLGYTNLTNCWISGDYVIAGYDVIYPTSYTNHVCSSNYIIAGSNNTICPHCFSNHEHVFVSYVATNALKHNKYCYCSYYTNERHNFVDHGIFSSCENCGYTINGEHPILIENGSLD